MRRVFELLGQALHGTLFREETTGTNSVATTYELRRAVAVHGDEHFIAQLHGFSCYGHPIIDPHTRRLEGVLSITCLVGERNPLLAPYVGSAAAEIEQLLLEGRSPNERALLAALQRELGAGRDRPTLAIGRDIFLANTAAIELLDAADHVLIRDIAASCTGDATKAAHVTLSRNREADITCRRLTPSAGAVLTITNLKSPTSQVLSQPLPDGPRGVLICGEPGAGHTTTIQMMAASTSLQIHHAARCTPETMTDWLSDIQQRASESAVVAVESIHLLSAEADRSLAGILDGFTGTVILSTILPPSELKLPTRQLISRCTERVQLTPLRQQPDVISEPVGSILRNLDAVPASGNQAPVDTDGAGQAHHDHRRAQACRRRQKRAAAQLGISRTTLYAALRTYDITTTSVSRS